LLFVKTLNQNRDENDDMRLQNNLAGRKLLFTPGPLNTSSAVRTAMTRDLGSRDSEFTEVTQAVEKHLRTVAQAGSEVAVVLLQGSGTFAVEAMIGSLLPRPSRVLVLVNGAYGERIVRIAERIGLSVEIQRSSPTQAINPRDVARALDRDETIQSVVMVHGETTTGLVNDLEAVATIARQRGRNLFVDAMSTFGGIPFSVSELGLAGLAASSNKCLEGAPGISFVFAQRRIIECCQGRSHSVSLDLFEQMRQFDSNGQWRFTPPTHVMAALATALVQLDIEGGVPARMRRHQANRAAIVAGFRDLEFDTLIEDGVQGSVIVTFKIPAWTNFRIEELYCDLADQNIHLYPGKLTEEPTFRVGCIGDINCNDIGRMLSAVERYLRRIGRLKDIRRSAV
jgi:2-aminoethylphosphonate-pyruvate transaminase